MERLHKIYRKVINKIFTFIYSFSFKKLGHKSVLSVPFLVEGAKYISIGKKVYVRSNAWMSALSQENYKSNDVKLSIGESTYIGRNAHIVALKNIRIGKDVLIGDNVYIADNYHIFDRIDLPYKDQGIGFKSQVVVGDGTWVGENVCIISSKIGKQCIVGANSLVIDDVPDYTMVVGSPARIVKKFNHRSKIWQRVD